MPASPPTDAGRTAEVRGIEVQPCVEHLNDPQQCDEDQREACREAKLPRARSMAA
jgi:hypothetical protein